MEKDDAWLYAHTVVQCEECGRAMVRYRANSVPMHEEDGLYTSYLYYCDDHYLPYQEGDYEHWRRVLEALYAVFKR